MPANPSWMRSSRRSGLAGYWNLPEINAETLLPGGWLATGDTGPWDPARYRRTARQLGRLAGRWPEHRVVAELGLRRRPMAQLFFSHAGL